MKMNRIEPGRPDDAGNAGIVPASGVVSARQLLRTASQCCNGG